MFLSISFPLFLFALPNQFLTASTGNAFPLLGQACRIIAHPQRKARLRRKSTVSQTENTAQKNLPY